MTKRENLIFALLVGVSALAAEEATARDRDGYGRLLDEPRGGLYREPSQDIRQERKSLRQDFRNEIQERARDRSVERGGVRPRGAEGRRELLMTPEEREQYQDRYRELREERKGLRGLTDDAGTARGWRGRGKNE
jgi:hypothetical protein